MLKKGLIIAGILLLILLVAAGGFLWRLRSMYNNFEAEYQTITHVNLQEVADGVYEGSFGDFLVHVDLQATVSGHKITQLEIIHQESGAGYEALETVDRIIEAQSPRVDAVTKATGSSICIMVATYRALVGESER
ncbi:hypothetical protein QA601_03690 [Chitinispirillales bacterium ANBcel5]|uniref:FMN-binding protein n=1 Tax=Cellulosispirillum alkaliphilum TaxID=3039283 RepID=UPI002A57A6FF|nr:hypothetical protein [Chitinispirillales bacterium ANBcel5]